MALSTIANLRLVRKFFFVCDEEKRERNAPFCLIRVVIIGLWNCCFILGICQLFLHEKKKIKVLLLSLLIEKNWIESELQSRNHH